MKPSAQETESEGSINPRRTREPPRSRCIIEAALNRLLQGHRVNSRRRIEAHARSQDSVSSKREARPPRGLDLTAHPRAIQLQDCGHGCRAENADEGAPSMSSEAVPVTPATYGWQGAAGVACFCDLHVACTVKRFTI